MRTSHDGPYLSADSEFAAPPWTALRDLETAAWTVQSDTEMSSKKLGEALRMLVAPGSSIGGARPKAGVVAEQGQLWIAKFPGRNDDRDVGAWGFGVSGIAEAARWDDVANTLRVGGYGTVDARVSWRFAPGWTLQANVVNAFDRDYQTSAWYAQPGREWALSLRWQPD